MTYTDEFHISAVRTAARTGAAQCVLIDAPFEADEVKTRLPFPIASASCGDIEERFENAGFVPSKKTIFSICGITPALDLASLNGILQTVAHLSSEGSSLVLDYDDTKPYAASDGAEHDMLFTAEALELMLSLQGFIIYEYIASDEAHPCLVHAVRMR